MAINTTKSVKKKENKNKGVLYTKFFMGIVANCLKHTHTHI